MNSLKSFIIERNEVINVTIWQTELSDKLSIALLIEFIQNLIFNTMFSCVCYRAVFTCGKCWRELLEDIYFHPHPTFHFFREVFEWKCCILQTKKPKFYPLSHPPKYKYGVINHLTWWKSLKGSLTNIFNELFLWTFSLIFVNAPYSIFVNTPYKFWLILPWLLIIHE